MTGQQYRANIKVKKPDSKIRYKALMKRAKDYKRSTLKITENAGSASFEIDASDLAALMATTNSVFRDAKVIEGTAKARVPQNGKRDKNIYK